MQTYECMNPDCAKFSQVREINWHDGKHVIECEHCRQWHVLRQLDTPEGAPIQFELVGLL